MRKINRARWRGAPFRAYSLLTGGSVNESTRGFELALTWCAPAGPPKGAPPVSLNQFLMCVPFAKSWRKAFMSASETVPSFEAKSV